MVPLVPDKWKKLALLFSHIHLSFFPEEVMRILNLYLHHKIERSRILEGHGIARKLSGFVQPLCQSISIL